MSVETVESAGPRPKKGVSILFGLTLLGLLLALWLALGVSTQAFWTPNNISNLLRQGAMTAILAVGQTFVIITAGIDLSVGAVVGFTSVIVAWLLAAGVPLWLAIIATLAIGVLIGAFHAFGIVRMGLPPFIITLATLTSLRGIGLLITNGSTISISITHDAFTTFSRADFLGVPSLFWMVIVVAIPAFVFLHLSRFGRYLFAVGSNREAARLSGVNVDRTIYLAYILSSTCAAFVGLLLASRIGIGNATQAEGWELQAIASSVIGGTSLFGAV
ncbi:ABC transporter, partial [Sinorhizobium medicae]